MSIVGVGRNLAAHVVATQARQPKIEHDKIRSVAFEMMQGFDAVACRQPA